ncbi:F-box protein [Platanthera guangdongensis]|uniref:F-box protein n=1 Tax=Platanthera guangdongensis TaxID=2320717 RepID=A0ABR2LV01_9ASPA
MKTKRAKRKLMKKETGQSNKMAQENTAVVVVVPNDVVFDILVRLPARSVGRFRCVSKSWLSITTHSTTFVRAHKQRSSPTGQSLVIERPGCGERFYLASAIAPADITFCKLNVPIESSIRASCDGLLCLWIPAIGKHRIVNPLTGRSIILPTNTRLHTRFLAFYFNHSTSEYRLLAAAQNETSMLVVGQNTWKHISCRLPAFCDHSYTADLKGSLHWLA